MSNTAAHKPYTNTYRKALRAIYTDLVNDHHDMFRAAPDLASRKLMILKARKYAERYL